MQSKDRDYNQYRTSQSRSGVSYQQRPVFATRAKSVDGFSERVVIVPANQNDYIDSLSNAPVSYSRFRQPSPGSQNGGEGGFGRKLLDLAENRRHFSALKPFVPVLAIGFVLIIAVAGLTGVGGNRPAEAGKWGTRSSIEPAIESSSEISEKRPSNILDYHVSDDLPRFLRINGMGISSRVRRVGVGTKTELRLPANIYDAGWYESSAKPGEPGAIVLTGHAQGPSRPGIFYDLKDLEPGDELEIETGAGDIHKYYVAKLEAYNKDASLGPMLVSAVPGSPGLNLITELGHFDTDANEFEKRLVVYAVQKLTQPADQKTGSTPVETNMR